MNREKWQANIDLCDNTDDVSEAFYIFEEASREYISSLEATIEAQEIIIRDKTAIMEAMVQPKTCEGCKYFFEDDFAGCRLFENDFTRCSRQFENDHYEPKAKS